MGRVIWCVLPSSAKINAQSRGVFEGVATHSELLRNPRKPQVFRHQVFQGLQTPPLLWIPLAMFPLLGKIFHNELYCLHLHFLPNLSSPFPIIILFPPIPNALVILSKSQATPQHTLSCFLPCLLLVFVSVFLLCFVFITHLSDRARGLGPELVLHKHVQIC